MQESKWSQASRSVGRCAKHKIWFLVISREASVKSCNSQKSAKTHACTYTESRIQSQCITLQSVEVADWASGPPEIREAVQQETRRSFYTWMIAQSLVSDPWFGLLSVFFPRLGGPGCFWWFALICLAELKPEVQICARQRPESGGLVGHGRSKFASRCQGH